MKFSDYAILHTPETENNHTPGQHLMQALSYVSRTNGLEPMNEKDKALLFVKAVGHVSSAIVKLGLGDVEASWDVPQAIEDTEFEGAHDITDFFTDELFFNSQEHAIDNFGEWDERDTLNNVRNLFSYMKKFAEKYYGIDLEGFAGHLKGKNVIHNEIRQVRDWADACSKVITLPVEYDAVKSTNSHAKAISELNKKVKDLQQQWRKDYPDLFTGIEISEMNVKHSSSKLGDPTGGRILYVLIISTILGDESIQVITPIQ